MVGVGISGMHLARFVGVRRGGVSASDRQGAWGRMAGQLKRARYGDGNLLAGLTKTTLEKEVIDMAEIKPTKNQQESDHEARREQQLNAAIAEEKRQVQRLKELVKQIAEECPTTWRYGDGDGGAVMNYLYDAAEQEGLRTSPNPFHPPHQDEPSPGEHTVYRFYDVTGALLYVGVSNNVYRRWEDHQRTKPWFPEVAVITRSLFDGRETAYKSEMTAIINERPKYNIIHNDGGNQ